MKRLKKIVGILIGLVAILLVVALFIPTEKVVKRAILISRNQSETFAYIKHLEHQEKYGVWWKADPNMKITTKGTDGTVGYLHAWNSTDEQVGQGQQRIIKIVEGPNKSRIDIELKFIKPIKSVAPSFMTTEGISKDKTRLSWAITSNLPYPMNLIGAAMNIEKMLGDDLEQGLKNLKVILDK